MCAMAMFCGGLLVPCRWPDGPRGEGVCSQRTQRWESPARARHVIADVSCFPRQRQFNIGASVEPREHSASTRACTARPSQDNITKAPPRCRHSKPFATISMTTPARQCHSAAIHIFAGVYDTSLFLSTLQIAHGRRCTVLSSECRLSTTVPCNVKVPSPTYSGL